MASSVALPVRWWWSVLLALQLRGQADFSFRPLAAIERQRDRRARDIIAYAYRHVPYYRDTLDRLKLHPADFRGAIDLAQLPVIEREQVQRNPDYFVSTQRPVGRYLRLRTAQGKVRPILSAIEQAHV